MPSVRRDSRIASAATRRSPRTSVRSLASIGDVGAGAHGQAEVGLRQRGGVVDAVADHGDRPALGLQPADDVDLVLRQHLGDHLRRCRPRAATDCGDGRVVAGQQDRRQAEGAQLADGLRALVGLTASATTRTPRAAPSQPTATAVRPAASAVRGGPLQLGGQREGPVGQQPPAADDDRVPSTTPGDAEPRDVGEVLDGGQGAGPLGGAAGDRPGDRVLRGVPPARRPAAAPRLGVLARRRGRRRAASSGRW